MMTKEVKRSRHNDRLRIRLNRIRKLSPRTCLNHFGVSDRGNYMDLSPFRPCSPFRVSGFYQQYGFRTFLASLLVGVYAGTTAGRFLRHVPKNRSAAVGLARELVDASRKAA